MTAEVNIIRSLVQLYKIIITVACLQVYVELVSWTAATLVAVKKVGADMMTAVIHHSTDILSYSDNMRRNHSLNFKSHHHHL